MIKFFNLVKNEYIKLMLKASTWCMIIILFVSAIGLPAIALFAKKQDEKYVSQTQINITESYQSEINYQKEAKPEGWERVVEKNQYMIDNAISEDWKINAVDTMFNIKYNGADYNITNPESVVNEIDNALKNDDWKKYFNITLEYDGIVDETTLAINKQCVENSISPYEKNWKYNILSNLEYSKSQLLDLETQKASGITVDVSELESFKEDCLKYQYRLDKGREFDISENTSWLMSGEYNFWSVFLGNKMIVTLVGVMVIVVAGGIVSGEFSAGTIKFLMINPAKRWKILASKYITTLSFGYLAVIFAYIISIFASLIFFGADYISASYISVSGDKVNEISGFVYAIEQYMISSVSFVVMGSLAFAVSSLFRSSALAIGISVMAFFSGNTVTLILSELQFDWGRYLIFANTDIASIIEGSSYFAGQTVGAALAVIGVHMVIFLLTAWDGFIKREI